MARLSALLSGRMRAVILMIISTFVFAIMQAAIRHVTQELDSLVVVFFRNFFGLCVLVPLFVRHGLGLFRTDRIGLHWIRATLNVIAMAVFYYGLSLTPLAEATALAFTAPLFTVLLAICFLGESVGIRRWTAILIGFTGAFVILRPGFSTVETGAVSIIISAVIWSGTVIIIKVLSRNDSSLTITAYMALLMAILSLPPALLYWQTPTAMQFALLALIGLTGTIGQLAFVEALSGADAQVVMPLDFMKLIWAALFGFLLFQEIPDIFVWCGALMIFSSATYVAIRERARDQVTQAVTAEKK
jgi:drug/metabolite transporter (DMT)-like permease